MYILTGMPVGSKLNPFWELRTFWTLGSTNVEGGLHSPFLVKPKLDKVTKNHQRLCTFSQEPILVRGITSAYGQDAVKPGQISGLLQSPFFGSKPRQPLETYSRSEQTKPLGDHQDLPPTRGVGYLNRFQGYLLPYTYTRTIQEMPEISHPRSGIPVQGPAIRFVHSTFAVHRDTKGG